ncbi:MAG: ankyrin repeat domain-containing protein [Pseudomonadota bacterium]
MRTGRFFVALALVLTCGGTLATTPAAAQFSERFEFFKAVKDSNAAEAKALFSRAGTTIINVRERSSGRTALHMVTERRDAPWINFLKQGGDDVNVRDIEGNTPLMVAADRRFTDGVQLLLIHGAKPDLANDRGETPLMRAVQLNDIASVRLLLTAGANPDLTDNVAGLSARDYAKRDRRAGRIAALIEENETEAAEVMGPVQ